MEQFELTQALKEKLENAKTLDDVLQYCAEEGIELTKEDLEEALPQLNLDSELNEDDLDQVSGGIVWGIVLLPAIVCAMVIIAVNIARRRNGRR